MPGVLYLDTSALVKLYVQEPSSDTVTAAIAGARHLATSRVAWPEMMAAMARRYRDGAFDQAGWSAVKAQFESDWRPFVVVELDAPLARRAGELAETHALRGFDAVHLASALAIADRSGAMPAFLAFDGPLSRAARACGMT